MITLVYPYYNNGGMLERQLSVWRTYRQPEQWSIVLVDDGSQEDPASAHLMSCGIDFTLYRITVDIPWNQDGARNLAMSHCTGWCLLGDIDHVLTADEADRLQAMLPSLDPKRAYRFERVTYSGQKLRPGANLWLLQADCFWRMGGYDEAFAGYYGSDRAFRTTLQRELGAPIVLPIVLTVYERKDIIDACTRSLGRVGSKWCVSSNPELAERMRVVPKAIRSLNFPWERVAWQPPQDS